MILKEDGFILMTVPIEAKVVYISANKDTAQLAVAFKNKIHIFGYIVVLDTINIDRIID